MRVHVIEISTEVYHLLQKRPPGFVSWTDEQPGPTQKIQLDDDVYTEFIDRAIAHRQTLDQVVRATCTKTKGPALLACGPGSDTRRIGGAN